MKKSLIALTVASLAAASANAGSEAGSTYVGVKAGWASFRGDTSQLKNSTNDVLNVKKNSVTYGVFGGYQIFKNLAAEVGYDYFGDFKAKDKTSTNNEGFKHVAHGATVAFKANYELLSGLDLYLKGGVGLAINRYKAYDADTKKSEKYSSFHTTPLLAAGFEYNITPSLAARVEYQYLHRAGKLRLDNQIKAYSPSISSVSAGLVYRFGKSSVSVRQSDGNLVMKRFVFGSDVLFDFGKANLKPEAVARLDETLTEVRNLSLVDPRIQVDGYTDRIGKEAANLKLSQRRAESVANYIVSKGINPANVTAVGYGKANPVTGDACSAVKSRKALITCLAPDRRVELNIQGAKEKVM